MQAVFNQQRSYLGPVVHVRCAATAAAAAAAFGDAETKDNFWFPQRSQMFVFKAVLHTIEDPR